ncbi:hypothetical protein BZL30_2815 [Mycobacterium kansasii]|uniref:Uncharacterized protein n=1 Tax=Mycobacterium kansasii TaxID=1768 RepID=A0A1V3XJF3_MYCKA|nr:hypothetical protein BZL30_2815 [Mycobacterium kansasii]
MTVAVRGMSRNKAISPTIMPGSACSTITAPSSPTWMTSALPDEMSRNDTACSPCRIRTWPAAARSGASRAASGSRSSAGHPAKMSIPASSAVLAPVNSAIPSNPPQRQARLAVRSAPGYGVGCRCSNTARRRLA